MSRHISSQNYQIIRVGGGGKTYLRDSEYTEFNTYRGQHNNEESSLIQTLAATSYFSCLWNWHGIVSINRIFERWLSFWLTVVYLSPPNISPESSRVHQDWQITANFLVFVKHGGCGAGRLNTISTVVELQINKTGAGVFSLSAEENWHLLVNLSKNIKKSSGTGRVVKLKDSAEKEETFYKISQDWCLV